MTCCELPWPHCHLPPAPSATPVAELSGPRSAAGRCSLPAACLRWSEGVCRQVCWELFRAAIAERLAVEQMERQAHTAFRMLKGASGGCEAEVDAQVVTWIADHTCPVACVSLLTLVSSCSYISHYRSRRAADWPDVAMWKKVCLSAVRSRQTSKRQSSVSTWRQACPVFQRPLAGQARRKHCMRKSYW